MACSVTQSTLSAGLLALERQLNANLLDRDAGRRLVFTPLGLELIELARAALVALETFSEAAVASRDPMTGLLRLGVIPTIGPFLLPRLMPVLREAFPHLRLYLREDTTVRLLDRLESNRLDAVILALPCDCGPSEVMPIGRDEFMVALPPGHPLADQPSVPVAAIANERLLLMEEGHCLRDQALAVCGLLGGDKSDPFAATSLHTLVQMVAGGMGVTLLPRLSVVTGIAEGTGVILRPVAGPGVWRTLGLAWRPSAPRASDFRALVPHLSETFRLMLA